MQIARVIGDVTATQKHPTHEGRKLLLVQPLNLDGSDRGMPLVAVDGVNAGIGHKVLLVQDGFAAFTVAGHRQAPLDAAVIGIIDQIELISGVVPQAGGESLPASQGSRAPAAKKQQKKNRS